MDAAHLYTPRTSPFRFPRYLCGSACYDMRFTRVKYRFGRGDDFGRTFHYDAQNAPRRGPTHLVLAWRRIFLAV